MYQPSHEFYSGVGAGIIISVIFVILTLVIIARKQYEVDDDTGPDTDVMLDSPVDPWQYQRMLMAASNQFMPDKPMLTKGMLLYWALIFEEVGELSEALAVAWREQFDIGNQSHPWYEPYMLIVSAGVMAQSRAKRFRNMLPRIPDPYATMSIKAATPILDGITDVMVVSSGFSLAAGLPGGRGYEEVQVSNLSKRNEQGMIDKTPDGKWEKGPNYVEPNLARVLSASS